MRSHLTHTLSLNEETVLVHNAREYLALVDLETYPAFVGEETDHLDMVAHLSEQMRSLTAVAWGAPSKTLNIRFRVTEDDHMVQHTATHDCHTTASGTLRTHEGRLCLTSHDRIVDCACHRNRRVLREQRRLSIEALPHVLLVPPGIYQVHIFYHFSFPFGGGDMWHHPTEPKVHFTVILRHYSFPPPRVAPVRLSGLTSWAGEEAASHAWGGITSHSRWLAPPPIRSD